MTPEATLERIVTDDFRSQIAPPPPPRFLLDFARSLRNPTGEFAGHLYDPGLHQGQIVFLLLVGISMWRGRLDDLQRPDGVREITWRACLRLGRAMRFLVAGDTQSGKSWAHQVVLFYCLCERKLDVLYGVQDMRAASDAWKLKLEPGMRHGGLAHHLPTSGSGSGGGTDVDTVHLTNAGSLLFNGAGGHRGKGGIDGRSVPIIFDDELDSLPMQVVNKNEARADAFFRLGRRFRTSTVKDDDASNILAGFGQSTQLRLHFRCLACRGFTPFEYEQVRVADGGSDKAARASVRIACAACGALHDEDAHKRMLAGECVPVAPGQTVQADGTLIGEPPESETCGLLWTCWDNPFKRLGDLVVKERKARIDAKAGRTQDLIDYHHDDLVRAYPKPVGEEDMDAVSLASRSAAATYPRERPPARCAFLVGTVDQQKRVLIWKLKAYDTEFRRWSVDWGIVPICAPRIEPTDEQRIEAFRLVHERMRKGWVRQDSSEVLRPVLVGVDVADWPDIAERFMRGKSEWIGVHGAGAEMVKKLRRGTGKKVGELAGWYDVIEYDQPRSWRVVWPHSDSVKHEVSRSFKREIDGPGASMLPLGLGPLDDLVQHLTAERWQYSRDLKRHAWIKTGRYNDWWDTNYYADVLAQWFITEHPNYRAGSRSAMPTTASLMRAALDAVDKPKDLSWTESLGWQ